MRSCLTLFIIAVISMIPSFLLADVTVPEMEAVIQRDAVYFYPDAIPGKLLSHLITNRVVLLAEGMHWSQNVPDLMLSLLKATYSNGFRTIALEMPHSFSWIPEDYVQGRIDAIPEFAKSIFDPKSLLDGIREFNRGRMEKDMVRVICIDADHMDSYRDSISAAEKFSGELPVFRNILHSHFNISNYQGLESYFETNLNELKEILAYLSNKSTVYPANIDPRWLKRLLDYTEIEYYSLQNEFEAQKYKHLTGSNSSALWIQPRDNVMARLIEKELRENDSRIYYETGNYHGQKSTLSQLADTRAFSTAELLAVKLRGQPVGIYSLACAGISGKYVITPSRKELKYDYSTQAATNDFTRILGLRAGDRTAFISFDDPMFTNQMVILFGPKQEGTNVPILCHDGLLTIPDMRVTEICKTLREEALNRARKK